jgi:polyhydroxyalkanoate synthesis regulator phasin
MKRLIWLPVAGFLLIAGAAVAAAAPGVAETAKNLVGINQAGSSPAPTTAPTAAPSDPGNGSGSGPSDLHGRGFGFGFGKEGDANDLLDQVLADLVSQGVITQEQSDAITSGLDQAITDKQAEAEAQRQQMQEMWQQIQGFLSDGVITQDEIAQLPADNPFSNLTDILADGQITTEELQSLPWGGFYLKGPGMPFGPGGPGRHGAGGPGWNDNGNDSPNTTPAPDPSSGASSNS